jgi:hypothetical protein
MFFCCKNCTFEIRQLLNLKTITRITNAATQQFRQGHEAGCVQEKLCQSFVFRNRTTIGNCCLILCNFLSLVSKKEICHFPHLNLFSKNWHRLSWG